MSNVPSTSLIPVASSSGSRVAPNLTMQIILRRDLVTVSPYGAVGFSPLLTSDSRARSTNGRSDL